MTANRSPRRRPDGGQRAKLVEAAGRVIAQEGIAAATTRRIAEEAGVPPGLVHYWFAGKDELLEAVILEASGSIESAVSRVAERAGGGPDVLSRLRAVFDVIENDDRGRQIAPYELTLWALRRPESRDLARRQYEEYHRVATEATVAWMRETGVESPDQVRPLAQFVTALFDGLILAWLADPESTDVDGVLRLVSELVEDHLRNRNG